MEGGGGLIAQVCHLPPRVCHGSLHQAQRGGGVNAVFQRLRHQNIIGVLAVQGCLRPQVEAQRPGYRHQHHAGQDADVGKAHGVLLHAVQQAGDGGEVAGLVIEALVGPQALQQGDGPGGEQAVGADHHQNDRHEKQHQGVHRVPCGDGDGIAAQQRRQSQERQ